VNEGKPLQQPVTDVPFLIIDFETTTPVGRPPEPLELAALRLAPGPAIDPDFRVSWLIRPPADAPLTAFDTRQTGIREQDIEHAPDALTVLGTFDGRLRDEAPILVAHNAHYEAALLRRFAHACPRASRLPFLDTVALGKHLVPGLRDYKLDTLARHFSLPIPANRHRALPDVELTALIFLQLLRLRLERFPRTTVPDLLRVAGLKRQAVQDAPAQMQLW